MGGRVGRVIRRQTKQTPPAVSPATLKRQDRFLEAFIKTDGSIVKSAKMARVARAQHYHWKTNDPDYIQRFKEAEDLALGGRRRFSDSRQTVERSPHNRPLCSNLIRITVPPPPPVANGPLTAKTVMTLGSLLLAAKAHSIGQASSPAPVRGECPSKHLGFTGPLPRRSSVSAARPVHLATPP